MSPNDRLDTLVEATLLAHRRLDADGLPLAPSDWWDLAPEDCERAYWLRHRARAIERTLDERGLSSTVKAVMARIPTF